MYSHPLFQSTLTPHDPPDEPILFTSHHLPFSSISFCQYLKKSSLSSWSPTAACAEHKMSLCVSRAIALGKEGGKREGKEVHVARKEEKRVKEVSAQLEGENEGGGNKGKQDDKEEKGEKTMKEIRGERQPRILTNNTIGGLAARIPSHFERLVRQSPVPWPDARQHPRFQTFSRSLVAAAAAAHASAAAAPAITIVTAAAAVPVAIVR